MYRLIVHLNLRPADPHAPADKTEYVIAEHENSYHQEDLAVVPLLVPLVCLALSAVTLSCHVFAWGFSNVLGCWRMPDGEAGKGVELDRKSTRLNSSHSGESRMPSSA